MQADNSATTETGGNAANIDSEIIGNDCSSNEPLERTAGPVNVVLVDPFKGYLDGQGALFDIIALAKVLAGFLDDLSSTCGLDDWTKAQIDHGYQVAHIIANKAEGAHVAFETGELVLGKAGPQRERRAA